MKIQYRGQENTGENENTIQGKNDNTIQGIKKILYRGKKKNKSF